MNLTQAETGEEDAGRWTWCSGELTVEVLSVADGCVVVGLWWGEALVRTWERGEGEG